ncbi:MAG TPA: M81 family metallopeptidase [Dongiaceae bacterium]|jgi:microcystin degradation protein MlrC|nr:M81 family metallopeptidase [Dongiaceae bacterium]
MARIAIGGFQHETNSFAPLKATYRDFEIADAWPGLTRSQDIIDQFRGMNLPISGFIESAGRHDLAPLLWCSASPSADVIRDAYERITAELLERLKTAGPVDALYLDLHGAMIAEHYEDGEGELLTRIRAQLGDRVPIVISLDLHANVTARMVALSDAIVVCRTYPHVDLAETGARAFLLIERLLGGERFVKAWHKLDFLVPLTWQCTLIEPAKSLYTQCATLERDTVVSTSIAFGFPPADIRECGPAVLAYGLDQKVDRAAAQLREDFLAAEADFAGKVWSPDEAVIHAMSQRGPIILADSQDNPGAGGSSDTVGLLEALLRNHAQKAVFANLCDPRNAELAHRAGVGAEITIELGAWSGMPGHRPFSGTFRVAALGDGDFMATGPFYRGNRMRLGPMARLDIGGVAIVLTSHKQQAADQAMLRHVGIQPQEMHILALKSSVHFRADFQELAREILIVAAPGANPLDNNDLPYKRLRPELRLMPRL